MEQQQQCPTDQDLGTPPFALPWDCLVLVLHLVGLPHRLTCCAAVSSTWHMAALEATTAIQHRSSSRASTAVLQAWLEARGGSLQAVQLSAAYHSTGTGLQVGRWACPRLQAVSLSHLTLADTDDDSTTVTAAATSRSHLTGNSSWAGTPAAGQCSSSHAPRNTPLIEQPGLGFASFKDLTSLSLQYCCLSSLASLAAVQGLRHLRLEKPQPPGFSPAPGAYTLDAAALASLQRLTSLQIVKGSYRGLLQAVCSLVGLQELQLVRCKDTGAAGFDSARLWQQLLGLTHLQVEAVPGLMLLASSSSGSSSQENPSSRSSRPLEHLLRLEVTTAAGFDPLLLSAARRLQYLQLTSTPLLGGAVGTAALLSVLGQITTLQHLNLRGTLQHVAPAAAAAVTLLTTEQVATMGIHAAAVAVAAAAGGVGGGATAVGGHGASAAAAAAAAAASLGGTAAYAGLTASSGLQYLDLSRCVLPLQAVSAMFAGSVCCSCVGGGASSGSCQLVCNCTSSSSSSSSALPRLPRLQELLLADTFALHAACDMQALVTACPGLRKLDIIRATPYATPLPTSMLSLLPALQQVTQLSMCNVDDSAAGQLAALTNLESLSVVWQSSISDGGVRGLTALRRLTQLWVHGALSSRLAPGYLLSLQSKELPPSVWSQLRLQACNNAADKLDSAGS